VTNRVYYTYIHRRADDESVFYAGCSCDKQRIRWKWKRTKRWNEIVLAAGGFTFEKIGEYVGLDAAHLAEIALIAKYGRECDGGTLCNLTAGGKGTNGMKFSKETCARLSASHKISNSVMLGDKLPENWRRNIAAGKIGSLNPMYGRCGADHPNSRKVIDRVTGASYDSVQIAAEILGYKMKTLYNWLSGHRRNPTSLEFE